MTFPFGASVIARRFLHISVVCEGVISIENVKLSVSCILSLLLHLVCFQLCT